MLGATFNHKVHDLQMPAKDAVQAILAEHLKMKDGSLKIADTQVEEFEKDVKKSWEADFQNAKLAGSGIVLDNTLPPRQRSAMLNDYAELATDAYRKTGDAGAAKAIAMQKIAGLYGVSNGEVMKFPPEKNYPPGRDGTHTWVYQQAADAIEARTGRKVDPKDIRFDQMDRSRTAIAYNAGQPAPYNVLYWRDEGGQKVLDMLLPERGSDVAFKGNVATMREAEARQIEQENRDRLKAIGANQTAAEFEYTGPLKTKRNSPEEAQAAADASNAFKIQRQGEWEEGRAATGAAVKSAVGAAKPAYNAVQDALGTKVLTKENFVDTRPGSFKERAGIKGIINRGGKTILPGEKK
jgi:hypothetical protein